MEVLSRLTSPVCVDSTEGLKAFQTLFRGGGWIKGSFTTITHRSRSLDKNKQSSTVCQCFLGSLSCLQDAWTFSTFLENSVYEGRCDGNPLSSHFHRRDLLEILKTSISQSVYKLGHLWRGKLEVCHENEFPKGR